MGISSNSKATGQAITCVKSKDMYKIKSEGQSSKSPFKSLNGFISSDDI